MRQLIVLVLVLAMLAALALTLRVELAQVVLPRVAKSLGIAFSADVTDIDHRQIRLRRVTAEGLTADAVTVRFRLAELVTGKVKSVRVEGLGLDIDLTQSQAPPAPESGIQLAGFPASALPEIELVDARLGVLLPAGASVLTAQATLRHRNAGELELAAGFDASTPWLPLRGRLVSRFREFQPLSMALDLTPSGDTRAAGRVAVRMNALDQAPELTMSSSLSLGPEATRLLVADSGITLGDLQLAHTVTLRPGTPLVLVGEDAISLPEWLVSADGEAEVRFDVKALGSVNHFQNADGAGAVSLALEQGRLRVAIRDPVTLSTGTVQREWLEQLALPAVVEALLVQGGVLHLVADDGGRSLLEILPDGPVRHASGAGTLTVSSGETRLALGVSFTSALPAVDVAGALVALRSINQAESRFELALQDVEVPELLRVRRARIAGEVSVSGEDLTMSLSGASTAVIELPKSAQAKAGPLTAALSGPIDLRLDALDATRPSIHARRSGSQTRLLLANRVDVRLADGSAVAGLLEGSADLDPDSLLSAFEIARFEVGAARLDVGAATVPQLNLRGHAGGTAERFSGSVQVESAVAGLRFPSVVADAIDASTALGFHLDNGRWRLSVDQPATVRLDSLSLPGHAAATSMTIAIQQGTVTLAPDGIVRLQGLVGDIEPLSVQILRHAGPPLPLALSSLAWSARGTVNSSTGDLSGEARVRLPRVLAPEQALALRDVDLALRQAADGPGATLHAARLVSTFEPPSIPALALSGTVEAVDTGYRFTVAARGAGDRLTMRGEGKHAVANGHGQATLSVAPVVFLPGELQPRDLAPVLDVLQDVSGRAEARAEFGWTDAELDGTGLLRLQDLAFDFQDTRVSGLNVDLDFEHLFPLSSGPQQKLRVARIGAGVPITNLDAALTILTSDAGSPYILIEQLSAAALGGRILLQEARIDPVAGQQRFTLELNAVELAALTEAIALDELAGRGRLVGRLPIRVAGDSLIIEGGRLQASGPGTLSFRSAQTRQTLAPGGETLDLMLQALEDFHYDGLTMTVDKPAAGESKIVLRLTGNNPAVLDGQPFDLSIKLTGDLAPLLSTLAEGNRLSSDMLRRLWRLQR
ncbi:MAG: YdbH domain-containing protein [Gammaproteobacteria bacterium]|nr:YdbH domain-containing protein [Gammaproteobacteria bacterium]